jgi:hypothetical protein
VLLVDDDEAEVGELHVLLDQRLRADGEVQLAVGERLERAALVCFFVRLVNRSIATLESSAGSRA